MAFSVKDTVILRELAKQVAEIAALPRQKETIKAWKAMNGLKPIRPMVMIDQMPWHEMNVNDELTLRCGDKGAQGIERMFRQKIYRWKHMPADFVVESTFAVGRVITGWDFGMRVDDDKAVSDPKNDVVGHLYHDQLPTDADLEKIKIPVLGYDKTATARRVAEMQELFGGILDVREECGSPMFNIWDAIVTWRGAENVLLDLGDRPEFMHKLMACATKAFTAVLDQLESLGAMTGPQSWIHCTGAFTDDLPAKGFIHGNARSKDMWTCGMAQIFSSVSPAMHQEFELDYMNPVYARFGQHCEEDSERQEDIHESMGRCRCCRGADRAEVRVLAQTKPGTPCD
jgi:hypothetical protein